MLFFLIEQLQNWLDQAGLGGLVSIMYQLEFRALFAVLLAFGTTLWIAPRTIRWLAEKKIGDHPEFYNQSINDLMVSRRGTPTMGGLFVMSTLVGTALLLADVVHSRYVQLAIIAAVWLALVGAMDDWLKLTQARRAPGSREGLFSHEKLFFQIAIALIVCAFAYSASSAADAHVLNLPFQRTYPPTPAIDSMIQPPSVSPGVWVLGGLAFTLIGAFMMVAMSNGANITDGLDGLAGSNLLVASVVMMVLAWVAGSPRAAYFLMVPHVAGSGELMVVAGAMVGSLLGFLWFNAHPARVFMGDTGSLPLGGLLAFIAVVIRQEILLIPICGILILELGSVALQVGWFKYTRKKYGEGRRILRCSPIHHHFQALGWKEQHVVTRSMIVSIVLAILALASLKIR
ncbi:MAG: phospho-N-acetylmuramoyl-pentapeptide-transferase [Planctomycetota bacterium]|nr:phospho-N-acetylmuramoyl-pentapeptide-transferase [Planctomycetota bacterium]MDA1106331.1 phospho-N-acetylmuramoyl-pentapeptide-transferase [Planctomycetota bacterium]